MRSGGESMAVERYHPLFPNDIISACEYYDTLDAELGERFRDSVRRTIESVLERPESFGRVGGEFRARQ